MSDAADYYEVLGVSRDATSDEIKRAYRALAREHHPDINKDPSAEARFKEIGEANAVLSDAKMRERYDAFGSDFRRIPEDVDPQEWARAQRLGKQPSGPPPGWESQADDPSFHAFFEDFLRQRGESARRWGPTPGADQRANITLSVEDAFGGGRRSLTLGGPTGDRTIQVQIPAGVTDGQTIRLRGQGGRGTEGAPAGDLYLHVTIGQHPRYRLDGRDIEVDLALSPWEAALGADVEVGGPGGATKIKVAPGTSSGRRLRIRGRGLPGPGGDGDLYARVKIVVPVELSDDERRLFEELAVASAFDPRSL